MKPTAWYDPTNDVASTDKDSPLFTPLGQVLPLYTKQEQEQEPVAIYRAGQAKGEVYHVQFLKEMEADEVLLYAAPVQRTWVGLTDEDFLEACQIAERGNYLVAFQRIQAKLKEKNT